MYCGDNWVFDEFKAQIAGDAQINPFYGHHLKQYNISRHSSTYLACIWAIADCVWTKRECPSERVDKLMENA